MFETFAEIWKDHLPEEAYRNLSSYGYYHVKHLDTNLRILSTFSLVYDIMNWYVVPNHTDPLGQLQFMEEVLELAEHNNEIVYIIGHIPPGDVFTLGKYMVRYRALINRFTNIIRGQYYGHTHYDEFKNVKSYRNDELSAGIVFAVPSITSYPRKNPSLRVWELDPKTWHIWDYEQHRLYVTTANKNADIVRQKPNYTEKELYDTAEWVIAYKFRDYFNISMEFEEIAKMIHKSKDDKEISK